MAYLALPTLWHFAQWALERNFGRGYAPMPEPRRRYSANAAGKAARPRIASASMRPITGPSV